MKLGPLPVRRPSGAVDDLVVTEVAADATAGAAASAGLDEVLAWLRSLES